MKSYNIFNEYGAFLDRVEAQDNVDAVRRARKIFPLEPIALEQVKGYVDLKERKSWLSEKIQREVNSLLEHFYKETGIPVDNLIVRFEFAGDNGDESPLTYNISIDIKLNI